MWKTFCEVLGNIMISRMDREVETLNWIRSAEFLKNRMQTLKDLEQLQRRASG